MRKNNYPLTRAFHLLVEFFFPYLLNFDTAYMVSFDTKFLVAYINLTFPFPTRNLSPSRLLVYINSSKKENKKKEQKKEATWLSKQELFEWLSMN